MVKKVVAKKPNRNNQSFDSDEEITMQKVFPNGVAISPDDERH